MASSTASNLAIFWFRRDLRLKDNHGLYQALRSGLKVLPIFIFDKRILTGLPPDDARVRFIYETLLELRASCQSLGSDLKIYQGDPEDLWPKIINTYRPQAIYLNHDYEPYAILRDQQIAKICEHLGVGFFSFKDQVIFEKSEVVKDDGTPYTVYTPYAKKWLRHFRENPPVRFASERQLTELAKIPQSPIPSLAKLGFKGSQSQSQRTIPPRVIKKDLLKKYAKQRDFPGIEGTSRLGVHLRFGTLSIRQAAVIAAEISSTWLSELIWREFFMMVLFHFPQSESRAFKAKYENVAWSLDRSQEFKAWTEGRTGYPIVDAGMRELNQTGFMHNRVRMITASFLTKHLRIHWKLGERYFAEKLLDFELASNVGNWQWAAGCGCDAAPYFRVFNPITQAEKFDPDGTYIRRWVPEIDTDQYPEPIVDHGVAREAALRMFHQALKEMKI